MFIKNNHHSKKVAFFFIKNREVSNLMVAMEE